MLKTEMRNPKTTHIDKMNTMEILQAINNENYNAVKAVEKALPQICSAIEIITESFKNNGRLFYLGAGTSGRLAVLDAAECPPTFGVSTEKVIALLAGGQEAMTKGKEYFEDSETAPVEDLKKHNLSSKDVVAGISAAGSAEYVLSGIRFAKTTGCKTIGITCNKDTPLDIIPDISIVTDTGPEVITGSTRLKAGTAQKSVLNMLTTASMIKLGYVYENLMINLQPSNIKLEKRLIEILSEIKHFSLDKSEKLLKQNDWDIKKII